MREAIAETVLQPSLHAHDEFTEMVFAEVEARGYDVDNLRNECAALCGDDDMLTALYEAQRDALDMLSPDYAVSDDNDTLIIYERGSHYDEETDEYVVDCD